MQRVAVLAVVALLCVPAVALGAAQSLQLQGGVTIWDLLPNTDNQVVTIEITGPYNDIGGADVGVKIGTGNNGNAPNTTDGPITHGRTGNLSTADVDMTSAGTLFNTFTTTITGGKNGAAPKNTPASDNARVIGYGVNNDNRDPDDSGTFLNLGAATTIFARLNVSTLGLNPGPGTYLWPLILGANGTTGSDIFDGQAALFPLSIPGNLQLRIIVPGVPEPTSVVMGMFALAGLGVVLIRRRKAA